MTRFCFEMDDVNLKDVRDLRPRDVVEIVLTMKDPFIVKVTGATGGYISAIEGEPNRYLFEGVVKEVSHVHGIGALEVAVETGVPIVLGFPSGSEKVSDLNKGDYVHGFGYLLGHVGIYSNKHLHPVTTGKVSAVEQVVSKANRQPIGTWRVTVEVLQHFNGLVRKVSYY